MSNIYDQFDAATRTLSAYAIADGAAIVGRVVIRHGGQCTAFCHIWGAQMSKGIARGGGYDRASAAVEAGFAKHGTSEYDHSCNAIVARVQAALAGPSGRNWYDRLADAGFTIQHVI
jgi:hypothetical protein